MMSDLRSSHDSEGLFEDLQQHGYCLIENLLDATALEIARKVVNDSAARPREQSQRSGDSQDWLLDERDAWVLLIAGESGAEFLATNETAIELAHQLLGARIHLSGFTAHIIYPGNQPMALHTDQWWLPRPTLPVTPPCRPGDITRAVSCYGEPVSASTPINPAVAINVMWALSDFTSENGCTRIVPGSHLSGCEPDPAREWTTIDAEVPAGGAVIWDARTWHASGVNRSTSPRTGASITYCGPQFRQLQNHTLALRPDCYGKLDGKLRELLGFRLYASYGATDDDQADFARPGYLRS